MTMLAPREGYRLWAPTYERENAVTALEDSLVATLTPPLAGLRLLDAGCGTGRRLRGAGAAEAVGVDICPEMIAAGGGNGGVRVLEGDVHALPLPDRAFDVVWCRLVIGHLPDCGPAYAELARVADVGARLIVTDFHPAAHAAGHRRTFRQGGALHELEHHVHPVSMHAAAARSAGLRLIARREAAAGPTVRHFYEEAGRAGLYAEHLGLPLVLALAFEREA